MIAFFITKTNINYNRIVLSTTIARNEKQNTRQLANSFAQEIDYVSIEIANRRGLQSFTRDEHLRLSTLSVDKELSIIMPLILNTSRFVEFCKHFCIGDVVVVRIIFKTTIPSSLMSAELIFRDAPRTDTVHSAMDLRSFRRTFVNPRLVEFCIAFHRTELPPFVLLEIFDFLPCVSEFVDSKMKIDCIFSVLRSCALRRATERAI